LSVNWALPFDETIDSGSAARRMSVKEYKRAHEESLREPLKFWESVASELEWFKKWEKPLDDSDPPFYRWFVGGELNASYLCVDKHAKGAEKNKVAIIWEGEQFEKGRPKELRQLTYGDLHREVNRAAYMLREALGVKKGDTVGFYLPMVPEFPILILAAVRIGASFTVVFSGFSADALAGRLGDAGAKLLITADVGLRKGGIVELKRIADEAAEKASCVKSILVVSRLGREVPMKPGRDFFLDDKMREVPAGSEVQPVRSKADDPLFVLHTSGTTGSPKGQVHDTGGYLTLLHATMKWVFDIRPDDVFWCTADIGWITGHSYMVFGPLLEGATQVMFEGSMEYPDPGRWGSVVERHGVTVLYTSPTAIRSFMRSGERWPREHDLTSVRLMHSVGEPINPAAFHWMHKVVGGGKIPFGSTWWMTETGGVMIGLLPGYGAVPMKPGTNAFPIPGVDADVVDEEGRPQAPLKRGLLVLKRPWPGMPLTINNDPERYRSVYWSRFPPSFYAGDYAVKDEDGYFWILGRADEAIKVAGHRLGTYELESALIQNAAVAEAAVVGVPDEVKGEAPVAFVILRAGNAPTERLRSQLVAWVRERVGPVASIRKVYFVSKLPKTRSAKIMRRVVRAVVAGQPVGDVTTLEDEASVDEVKKAYAELKGELNSEARGSARA
jgi:acetyl-CoA synthetase